MFDPNTIRSDFPIFKRRINGKPIVYLDSTATSLKPQSVIDTINWYYRMASANVFRGIYTISEEATAAYEQSRVSVGKLIGVSDVGEIIFTRNTSESLNLLAYAWLPDHVKSGDNVVTTVLEHHSNFVPWQQMAGRLGYEFRIWHLDENGQLAFGELDRLVTKKTKLLAITAASNVIGTLTPIADIVNHVKQINPACLVVVDAAQAVPHMPVDVHTWGADAVAFSGHKMLGPSGVGVLWMKREHLETMKPFLYGGDMIREVHESETLFNDLPHKFEAGTPFIEGAMGIGAAADYLLKIGMKEIRSHEKAITTYALKSLSTIDGLTVYGPKDPEIRGGVVSFRLAGVHPHDTAQILNEDNICVRVGYHCAMPLHEFLAIGPTVRASFYIYSTTDDVDRLVEGLGKVKKMFR
jgi:cysteine desulfurase/selenocysteine lyase